MRFVVWAVLGTFLMFGHNTWGDRADRKQRRPQARAGQSAKAAKEKARAEKKQARAARKNHHAKNHGKKPASVTPEEVGDNAQAPDVAVEPELPSEDPTELE